MPAIGDVCGNRVYAPLVLANMAAGVLSMMKYVAALAALMMGAQLAALPLAAPAESEAVQAAPETQISAPSADGADNAIKNRIAGIFDELPELEKVGFDVRSGVVILSGTVPDADAMARAEEIAGRIDGVATVRNEIERSATVDDGIGVLGNLGERAAKLTAMLPLIGLALLIGLAIAATGYAIAAFRPLWNRIAPNGFLAELIASAIRFIFVVLGIVIAQIGRAHV